MILVNGKHPINCDNDELTSVHCYPCWQLSSGNGTGGGSVGPPPGCHWKCNR